jgi:hypothetical protein
MDSRGIKDALTDAIRYWERRRLTYNAILALIVIGYFWRGLPDSKHTLNADFVSLLFVLAVGANLAYCSAYIADVFAQMSDFREVWCKTRWILFTVGTVFAAVITRFVAMGMFSNG